MGKSFLLLIFFVIAGCASLTPPVPPAPLTPHSVTAADYPSQSVTAREQGATRIRYVVLDDGRVAQIVVARSSGFAALDLAAEQLVERWQFAPAMQGGHAVVWGPLFAEIRFELR